jgi:hypothetical protein
MGTAHSSPRSRIVTTAALALALVVSACGSGDKTDRSARATSNAASTSPRTPVVLEGARFEIPQSWSHSRPLPTSFHAEGTAPGEEGWVSLESGPVDDALFMFPTAQQVDGRTIPARPVQVAGARGARLFTFNRLEDGVPVHETDVFATGHGQLYQLRVISRVAGTSRAVGDAVASSFRIAVPTDD